MVLPPYKTPVRTSCLSTYDLSDHPVRRCPTTHPPWGGRLTTYPARALPVPDLTTHDPGSPAGDRILGSPGGKRTRPCAEQAAKRDSHYGLMLSAALALHAGLHGKHEGGAEGGASALVQPRGDDPPPLINADFSQFLGGTEPKLVVTEASPYLTQLSIQKVTDDAKLSAQYFDDTVIYFGLGGECQVDARAPCYKHELSDLKMGYAVMVRNGARHEITGKCAVAAAVVPSGNWNESAIEGDPAFAGFESPCLVGGTIGSATEHSWGPSFTLPQLRTTATGNTTAVPARKASETLAKKVHLNSGLVPGLVQLSVGIFAPGAQTEERIFEDATEVILPYSGSGCRVTATAKKHVSELDLFPSNAVVLHPGTAHTVSNPSDEPCETVHFLLVKTSDETLQRPHPKYGNSWGVP